MLKTCFLSQTQQNLTNNTCGEIVCQSESSFFIVCKICDIKIFEYSEFIEHFRVLHWSDILCAVTKGEDFTEVDNVLEDFQTISIIEQNAYGSCDVKDDDQEEDYTTDAGDEDFDLDGKGDKRECSRKSSIIRKAVKSKGKQFECNHCSRSFSTKFYLTFHIRQQHAPKEFQCDKCDKTFVEQRYLTLHQRIHDGYTCKTCGKVFEKYEALRYHVENHIETRDFICDYENCGKGFPNKRRLSAHKRNHFAKPSYVCEICGSRQRCKEFLNVHIRTHTGEKPYACTLCDRRFASKHFLTDHMAVHATERPHVCDVCGKAFAGRKSLYHHRYLHSEVKKFVCKICERAYSQAAGLSAHMRKHKLLGNSSSLL